MYIHRYLAAIKYESCLQSNTHTKNGESFIFKQLNLNHEQSQFVTFLVFQTIYSSKITCTNMSVIAKVQKK